MSWTDKFATANILRLKNDLNINTAVVTGVCKGGDAELYGHHFRQVFAVDIDEQSLAIANRRLAYLPNVHLCHMDSAEFIRIFRHGSLGTVLYYLDAHFFDPALKQKWVVVNELKALMDCPNCVIIIHDYNNGLGHLVYGGEHMGWDVVSPYLRQVNPDFHYYTNTRALCDIYTEQTIHKSELRVDAHILDGIKYANTSDVKRYRGILYAVPRELDIKQYQLKEGYG